MRKHRKKLSILLILALLWTIAAPGLTFAGAEPAKELYMRFNPAVYNPTKGSVTIEWTFEIPHTAKVLIYPVGGNEDNPTQVLTSGKYYQGDYVKNTEVWDGKDSNGKQVPNGVYRVVARPLEPEWSMFTREASLIVTTAPTQNINITHGSNGKFQLFGPFYPDQKEVEVSVKIDGTYQRLASTDESMWTTDVDLYENQSRSFAVTKKLRWEEQETDGEGNTYTVTQEETKYIGTLRALKYVVKRDDTLSKIAGYYYKNSGEYQGIARVNNIPNPGKIREGMVLIILEPKREGAPPRPQKKSEPPVTEQKSGFTTPAAISPDPVNLATGNFLYRHQDLTVPGAFPLPFTRIYISQGNYHGTMGINWHTNYDLHLNILPNDDAQVVFEDGRRELFTLTGGSGYQTPAGSYKKLVRNPDETFTLTYPNNWKYHFSAGGQLTKLEDPNGNKTELIYEDLLLREIRNKSGYLLLQYDSLGYLREVSDQAGRTARYNYANYDLTSFTDPLGNTTEYQYNDHKLVKIVSPNKQGSIENVYDGAGRVIEQTAPDGGKTTFAYNEATRTTTMTDAGGHVTAYQHDDQFRLVKKVDPLGYQETFQYNDNDEITVHTDKKGITTYFAYDNRGNLLETKNALGETTTFTYDGNNHLLSMTGANGQTTSLNYDSAGNLLSVTDPLGQKVDLAYDSLGLIKSVTEKNGASTRFSYDGKGNVETIQDPLGHITSFGYDGANRLQTITDPKGNKTTLTFDANGRLTKRTDPEGNSVTIAYNQNGKPVRVTDQANNITEYHYDSGDRLKEQVNPLKGQTVYEYDSLGNVQAVTDAEGNKTRFGYDGLGRITGMTDAAGNETKLYYDANGNLTKVVNPKGGATEYAYDLLNRLTSSTDPAGAATQYAYNQLGQVSKVIDALSHQTTFDYDTLGRLVAATDALGNVTRYEYNNLNRISKFTKPNGAVYELKYDALGQLTELIDPLGNRQNWAYDENGNVSKAQNPLGSITQYGYDPLNRVKTITNTGSYIKEFQYTKRGQLAKATDERGNATSFAYDALGRLTKVTDALGYETDYQYDKVGNLTAALRYRQTPKEAIDAYNKSFSLITPLTVASGSPLGGSVPALTPTVYDRTYNGLTARVADAVYGWFSTAKIMQPTYYRYDQRYLLKEVENAQGKIIAYDYDTNGNLTKITDRDGYTTGYSYDQADRLTKISYADGRQVNFGYNLLGQMTSMSDWLGSNTFEVDPLGRVTKVTDFLNRVTKYSYTSTGQKAAMVYPDGSSVTYAYNQLDRLTGVTDAFGKTTKYNYDPAGNLIERLLPNGSKTTLSYDPLSQVQKLMQLDPSGKITDTYEFSYDAAGNKTQITKQHLEEDDEFGEDEPDENDTLKFTYDALNQLKTVTEENEERREYLYDSLGNRVALIETDMESPVEQLGRLSDRQPGQFSNGQPNVELDDGQDDDLDDDRDDHPDGPDAVFYRYDELNRLIQIKDDDRDIKDLSYDGRGNLTKIQSFEHDDDEDGDDGEDDENDGHLFSQFTFDAANRLINVVNKHGDKTSYAYNGFGQRVQTIIDLEHGSENGNRPEKDKDNDQGNDKDNPGNHNGWENGLPPGLANKPGWTQQHKRTRMVTNYAVDMLSPTQDVLLSYGEQVQTQRFTYGLEMFSMHFQSLADHDNGWAPQGDQTVYTGKWETLYALQDELGSLVKLIGENGKMSSHYNYDEFGRPEGAEKFDPNWPGPDNAAGYTGYDYDYYAGLYYANARYYMPEVGRFISEDPWNGTLAVPNTLNPYPYVLNNPLKFVDPLGLSPQTGKWAGDYALGTSKIDYSVFILAGVDTYSGFFGENNDPKKITGFVKELQDRYAKEGKKVSVEVIYPYGKGGEVDFWQQVARVANDMSNEKEGAPDPLTKIPFTNYGGRAAEKEIKSKYEGGEIILIGHSGGGVAAYRAANYLEGDGYNIHQVVQIGSPRMSIEKEWRDKVSAVEASGIIGDPITKAGGFIWFGKPDKTAKVDIEPNKWDNFNGHRSYFDMEPDSQGVPNVTKTTNAIWNWIK